ncbi:MAG: bacillithiol biosynthesis BshC [Thermoanaerobaculia bacterium]
MSAASRESDPTSPGGELVPLEKLPGIPALACGLATGAPDVRPFLPDAPTLEVIAERAAHVLRGFVPRTDGPAGLEELTRGRRAGIFTGQQVGLFTGPVLTTVKAVAAIQLARELTEAGTAVSAAFWCAAEDHDLVEVSRLVLPGPDGPRDVGPDPEPLAANRAPVGGLPIPSEIEPILQAAAELLGQPPEGEALEMLRATGGRTFRDAFQELLGWLLAGQDLALVDASRREDKPELVPLAARLLRERADVKRLLTERADALEAAGHPLQVKGDARALPLFALVGGERFLLRETGARLELKGLSEETWEVEEVIARFESGEWLPSFSAMTRPLAASRLFPVAATILGPAEIAYWAQMLPLFGWAGIVPPVIVPRPMVALVDPGTRRLLSKLNLSVADLLGGPEPILKQRGAERADGALGKIQELRQAATERLGALRGELLAIDAALAKPVDVTSEKISFALDKLVEKAAEASGRADTTLAAQLRRLAVALVPEGRLAERVYSPLTYLLRHGRAGVVTPLLTHLRWNRAGLQVIDL